MSEEALQFIEIYKTASEEDCAYLAGLLDSSRGVWDKDCFTVFWEGGRTDDDVWKLMEHLQLTFGPIIHTDGPDIAWQPLLGEPMQGIYQRILPFLKSKKHRVFRVV